MAKKKKGDNRRRNWIIIIILGILVIASLVSFLTVNSLNSKILVHARMNTTVNISDYVGINLNRDKLNFGTTSTSGYSERSFVLFESYDGYIYMTANEPMADWLLIPNTDNMQIHANVNRTVALFAVPRGQNAVQGGYESTIDIWVLKERPDNFTKNMLGGIEIKQVDPGQITSPKVSLSIVRQNSTK